MLGNSGHLGNSILGSNLKQLSTIRPSGNQKIKNLVAGLMLTSLVDAFSILVVYLLINYSAGEVIDVHKDIQLPNAANFGEIKRNIMVKVVNEEVFLEDEKVDTTTIVSKLLEIKKKGHLETSDEEVNVGALTIQADKKAPYKSINNIVLAASHAGFSDIHFAIEQL